MGKPRKRSAKKGATVTMRKNRDGTVTVTSNGVDLRKVLPSLGYTTGNAPSTGTACVCGHAVEEHGNDPEFPGSTACQYGGDSDAPDDGCDCVAYERDA